MVLKHFVGCSVGPYLMFLKKFWKRKRLREFLPEPGNPYNEHHPKHPRTRLGSESENDHKIFLSRSLNFQQK